MLQDNQRKLTVKNNFSKTSLLELSFGLGSGSSFGGYEFKAKADHE